MQSMSLGVLAFLALAVTPPATAQVSPTFLPGDTAIGPAVANQMTPALCLGGDQILAVWTDSRTSPITTGQQSANDIFAVRLDATGAPLDPVSFPVTMAGGDQRSPRVAWNGNHWLVVWVGQVSTASFYTDGLLAARVAPDGTVVDSTPIVVVADLASGTFGDVASDGTNFAVFYTGWDAFAVSHIYAKRVAANGTLLDAAPKNVATPGSSPSTPFGVSAAWAGNRYLVAWSQWTSSGQDNVRGQLSDASLLSQGATFNIASHTDYEIHPDVASNGSQFFVVWDRYNTCCVGGASKTYGTRVTTSGSVLDASPGLAIYDTNGYGFQGSSPAVCWDGTQWVASWTEPEFNGGLRVNAGRISASGVVLDFNGFEVDPLPVRQEAPAIVGRPNGGSLVAWQDSRALVGQPNDIYASSIDAAGTPVALGSLADSAPSQVNADSAAGPDGSAILAWSSMHSGLSRVMAQRVSRMGVALTAPLEVGSASVVNSVHVAWDGTRWIVVWDEYPNGVKARRIAADFTLLDAAPIGVMSGYSPDVAADASTGVFLVTALVPESNPQFVNVRNRRVSGSSGTVLDGTSALVGSSYATAQRVESFAGGFLVAWEWHPTHDNPWSNVGLRFVSTANVAGAQSSLSSPSTYNARPAIAVGDDGQALVVWQKNPSTSITEDILGRFVEGANLTLSAANVTISAAARSQQSPTAAWDGTQYLVSWQDTRANSANYLFDRRTDIYAARVTATGTVLDPNGVALAIGFEPEAWPTAVGLGIGSTLITWSDFEPQAPSSAYRLAYTLFGGSSPWVDLAHGKPGVAGTPKLLGSGPLLSGTTATLTTSNAAPSAFTALVIGASALNLPYLGGTLVPNPDVVITGFVTDPAGMLTIAGTWPAGVPSDVAIWFQSWIQDPAAFGGLSASNGLEAITP